MAIKFFKSIDLTNNELQNAKLHLTGTAPSALEGAVYFDTSDDKVKIYVDGGVGSQAWQNIAFESWATSQFLEDSEVSTFAKTILDDTSAAAVRTTIGAGTSSLTLGTTSTTALAGNTTTITTSQANAITANSAKTSFPGFGTTSGTALEGDTTTITSAQASAITANSAKTSFPGFGTTSGTALEGDTELLQLGTTSTTALAGNTTTITTSQANAITANSAKTSFPGFGTTSGKALEGNTTTISSSQATAITANSAKVSFPGFGTTASTALAGNAALDDVSNANLLTALAGLESTNGSGVNENITIGASAGDTIVITGNLKVSGTTTTLNTETVTIEDNIILLNSNVAGSGNGTDAGIEVERGDDTNVSLFWDESESAWTVTNTQGTYEILQSVGGTTFKVDLDDSESSVSKSLNTYTVTHNLGTKDVIVQVVDISGTPTYETVFTENQRPTTDTVTVSFASSVTDGDYRVLISQV